MVAAFAVANRHDVDINFDPLPFGLAVPLFVIVLASALVGLIVGGLSTWMSGRGWRRNARKLRRSNALLETEVAALREQSNAAPEPTAQTLAQVPSSRPGQPTQNLAGTTREVVG